MAKHFPLATLLLALTLCLAGTVGMYGSSFFIVLGYWVVVGPAVFYLVRRPQELLEELRGDSGVRVNRLLPGPWKRQRVSLDLPR